MKAKALVFGTGGYFRKNEQALKEDYEIVTYVDNYKCGQVNDDGKVVINPNQIKEFEGKYSVLIIMLEKVAFNMEITKQLILDENIEANKIKIGLEQFDFNNEFHISVLEDGRWNILLPKFSIIVNSEMEFWDLYGMYYEDTYFYKLNNSKKDVVIDIGMNIGDSTIYYLNRPKVAKVYGFEPFLQTYLLAEENIKRNHFEESRYKIFQYGLSDHDEKKKIFYHPEISIMLSTDSKFSELECSDYERSHCCKLEKMEADIEVRRASGVIRKIIDQHPGYNIVLKIDCEGEEYAILGDLDKEGVLSQMDYIFLEWHYEGKEKIEGYLDKNGFSYSGKMIRKDLGQISAWRQMERF